ncbi:small-conductance mechanosensitive channel [Cryobacterium mesophilum]|uniref:Mechanosensitive ion channel n=1 Tax=Terrimesophilobacter mesophilus TaxID=433647 RepID=A0A4R8VDF9_9MICO|nr:mechanosensitive ion channel family protein [Terrimesophilobacter mesophilus]MBB5633457.1 small-conductance mechanosensitive channel [Terrimesophilobacter mesophilus]TFB80172.1 mechanosensitive ion channel [Terrimesophilobacter mesophilus]
MADFLGQPWFWPAVTIVVGLPILLLILTEAHSSLIRRGSRAARIVSLLRNFIVPVGALLLLISQTTYLNIDWNWTRIVATVFGFLIILLLVNGLNLALFESAQKGTWRQRVPSIFVEIVRLIIIIVCLGALFAFVWGADIGGLFTALGVGSIVIGLALQNAVGSVISGLLLLFEQPFELGDWLDADGVRGRVVEVNWRSVHIQTDEGIRIVPNAHLAASSFVNLSRSPDSFSAGLEVKFSTDDPPQTVIAVCQQVARGLPQSVPGQDATVTPMRKGNYKISLSLRSPSDEFSGPRLFKTRIWYAARRAGLHYDNDLTDNYQSDENYRAALLEVAHALYLSNEDAMKFRHAVTLERYGAGEVVQQRAAVPDGMRFILSGTAALGAQGSDGSEVVVSELAQRDIIGLASLTRQAVAATVTAVSDLSVLFVPNTVLDVLVSSNPELALDIGTEIDNRRAKTIARLKEFGLEPRQDNRLSA